MRIIATSYHCIHAAMYISLIYLGRESCIDSVDIQQTPDNTLARGRLGIIPHLNFSCNGRIIGIRAKVYTSMMPENSLYIQVWRSSSTGSYVYNKTDEVQLKLDEQLIDSNNYAIINISLTGNDVLEFQSGDVIGYYHPAQSRYQVTDILTTGYVLYQFNGSSSSNSLNISQSHEVLNSRQPLLQFIVGMNFYVCLSHNSYSYVLCTYFK